MEVEATVLACFDLYWFRYLILRRNLPPPPEDILSPITVSSAAAIPACLEPPLPPEEIITPITYDGGVSLSSEPTPVISTPTILLRRQARHRRSRSDEFVPIPTLRIQTNKLQTIFSGKVAAENPFPVVPPAGENSERRCDRHREVIWRRRKKGESKSLSDLEFEELKGITDLGFTFSEAEAADPRLISIVPGLQRLREAGRREVNLWRESSLPSSEKDEEIGVSRPYLSEAWDAAAEDRRNVFLKNWRIPAGDKGGDLKDHLRLWAQSVASAVR